MIEANDYDHVCSEYWKSKQQSAKPPTLSLKDGQVSTEGPLLVGTNAALMSLFKKANPEELLVLRTILSEDNAPASKASIIQVLDQEIQRHDPL